MNKEEELKALFEDKKVLFPDIGVSEVNGSRFQEYMHPFMVFGYQDAKVLLNIKQIKHMIVLDKEECQGKLMSEEKKREARKSYREAIPNKEYSKEEIREYENKASDDIDRRIQE